MGIRLLFLLLALAAIWLIVSFYWRSRQSLSRDETPAKLKAGDMVSCHQCGLHVPKEEAIKSGEYWYCCREHADPDHED